MGRLAANLPASSASIKSQAWISGCASRTLHAISRASRRIFARGSRQTICEIVSRMAAGKRILVCSNTNTRIRRARRNGVFAAQAGPEATSPVQKPFSIERRCLSSARGLSDLGEPTCLALHMPWPRLLCLP